MGGWVCASSFVQGKAPRSGVPSAKSVHSMSSPWLRLGFRVRALQGFGHEVPGEFRLRGIGLCTKQEVPLWLICLSLEPYLKFKFRVMGKQASSGLPYVVLILCHFSISVTLQFWFACSLRDRTSLRSGLFLFLFSVTQGRQF